MATNPNQPGDPTPPPLNEEHMLEWVEGRLSRIEESKRAAGSRPGVAVRVRQMQANRRALQSLGEERAPAELMERVLAALERETLLGLTQGEDVEDHPPIPIAPHIEAKQERRPRERWVPMLAMAAGLLMLVSGAVYWGSILAKPTPGVGPRNGPVGPIAINDKPKDIEPPSLVREAVPASADAAVQDTAPVRTALAAPAAVENAADTTRADEAAVALITAPLSEERVLQLAREGRLVMRVYARDTKNLTQLEAMDTLKNGRTWRVSKDVPMAVASAVLPVDRPVGPPTHEDHEPALAQAASLMGASAAINWPVSPVMALPIARLRATYLVDFLDTPKGLASVKVTFKDKLRAGVAFEELSEAVDIPKASDAEGLLWWTLPPSGWTQRVTIPVVVESR